MAALLRKALATSVLRAAFERVRENRGQAGVDGVTVDDFVPTLAHNISTLQTTVLGGHYHPQPLKRLWLQQPGKTPRPIGIPTVRDRVLQTAVTRTITPLVEAEFEECSYAYRQGRSVRMAVERIGLLQRQGYRWVVEADIERFFDRIPQARVLAELREVVHDDELVALVGQWLTAPVQDGHQLMSVTLGIPQGSPISPLLANLYLNHLDETLLDENHALVRYADDFIVLAKSRERAEAAVELSAAVLRDLELKLNPLKTRVVNFDIGFEFLGWNFVRSLAVPARRAGEAANEIRGKKKQGRDADQSATVAQGGADGEAAAETEDAADTALSAAFADARADRPEWHPARVGPMPEHTDHDESAVSLHLVISKIESGVPNADPPATSDEDALLSETSDDVSLDPPAPLLPAALPVPPATGEHDGSGETELDDEKGVPPPEPLPSLQRTLYLVDPAASLATENRRLLVRRNDAVVLDVPAINVDQVMIFGRNAVTTAALVCCMQHGIPVALLSRMGKFYGRLDPPTGDAVRIHAAQFAAQNNPAFGLTLARALVRGKLANALLTLSRYSRHRRTDADERIRQAILLHRHLLRRIKNAGDLDTLRGFEGAGAAAYFGVWRVWLGTEWAFGPRVPRVGADPINALLDLGYTLLRQAIAGMLQARGLNPWLGHLHRVASGHMALASDLMEEFRPLVVDATVLNACLNGRLRPDDFIARAGAHVLKPEPARRFIRDLETRLNTERLHPRTADKIDLRRIIDVQVRALAFCYRQADAGSYEPCVFR